MILILMLLGAGADRRLLAEIEAFDMQIAALDDQARALEGRAEEIRAQEASHLADGHAAAQVLDERKAGVEGRMRALYLLERRGVVRVLLDAESPADLRRRIRYLLEILRADDERTRSFLAAAEGRREAERKVEEDRAVIARMQEDLDARRRDLTAERDKRVALLAEIRSTPELAARVVEERSAAASTLATALPTAPSADGSSFRAERGRLPAPVVGKVVRGFGPYTDPVTGAPATNLGVDYAPPLGTPFRAVADGVVVRVGYVRGYGQMVVVQHGSYTTLYAHANGTRVAGGQSVQRGDVLGLVGNTGLTEDAEARLHFEVRYNGTPQDPSEWLARR